jgi:hypothetical protein
MFGAFFVTTNWYPAICQPATTEPSSASRERSRQSTSHAWFLRQDGDDLAELQLFVHRLRCIIRDTLVSGSAAADLMLWKISGSMEVRSYSSPSDFHSTVRRR